MMDLEAELAIEAVESFQTRFGEGHLWLAYHAAVPLALTPDLLYHIWANFQRDLHDGLLNIPWIAVADLLLSPLCQEIRYETYSLTAPVRALLLPQMMANARFGPERLRQLGFFLIQYVARQRQDRQEHIRQYAESQELNALIYIEPQQAERALASRFAGLDPTNSAAVIRLASLTQTVQQASQATSLLPMDASSGLAQLQQYGDTLAGLARGALDAGAAAGQLATTFGRPAGIDIAGYTLPGIVTVPDHGRQTDDQPAPSPSKTGYRYHVRFLEPGLVRVESYADDGRMLGELTGRSSLAGDIRPGNRLDTMIEAAQNGRLTGPSLRELGEMLFDAVFQEPVRGHFLNLLAEARQSPQAVLRLLFDPGAENGLSAVPWELLHLPGYLGLKPNWLAATPNITLSVQPLSPAPPDPLALAAHEPLRLAFIAADYDPALEPRLEYDETEKAILDFAGPDNRAVQALIFREEVTPEFFHAILAENRPHIVHFVGHVRAIQEYGRPTGQMALAGVFNEPVWLDATGWRDLFSRHTPALLLLQTTARSNSAHSRGLIEMAESLVQALVPAVVVLHLPIADASLSRFLTTFYNEALLQGRPLDEAIQAGRRAIALGEGYETTAAFAAPRLISRRPDDALFTRPAAAETPAAAGETAEGMGEPTASSYHLPLNFNDILYRTATEAEPPIETLTAVNRWLGNSQRSRVLWLNGSAGSGKTALSARLALMNQGDVAPPAGLALLPAGFLSAVHFCRPDNPATLTGTVFVQSVASQLANRFPGYARLLQREEENGRQMAQQQMKFSQSATPAPEKRVLDMGGLMAGAAFDRYLVRPLWDFYHEMESAEAPPLVILIDGCDESPPTETQDDIFFLMTQAQTLPANVFFILTGRPESEIGRRLEHVGVQDYFLDGLEGWAWREGLVVNELTAVVKAASGLNLRAGPGSEYNLIIALANGTPVTLLEEPGGEYVHVRARPEMVQKGGYEAA
jgi:hypothetical protein